MEKQRFQALSRICLNNWHYIDKRILSFAEGINFFTGHSGSGKSTVIDAMQILLYANTDGRGFFNKAAADDSDRTLIEYLRGMVNIGENNEFSYLRNKNFSSTIVMELKQTDTQECQSIGVAFDVESATNEISRLFFWHRGPFPESGYRNAGRAMSTDEIKEYLQIHCEKDDFYIGPSNERFRRQLYDVYLGGLDMERFPLLFKRAIPFKMNIKLEDFVKEYICLEEDIHIEDMQESVMQYGRMRKKIGDIKAEIAELTQLQKSYKKVEAKDKERQKYHYFMTAMEIRKLRAAAYELQVKMAASTGDRQSQEQYKKRLEEEIAGLEKESRELLKQIASSGYDEIKVQLKGVNEIVERLGGSVIKWQQAAEKLSDWEGEDITPNTVLWDIERFRKQSIEEAQIAGLKTSLSELRGETEEQKKEADGKIRDLKKQEKEIQEELKELRQGRKAYPKELEQARQHIRQGLKEMTGKVIPVEILADLLDIRDDKWRNAVEGYMAGNKLLLIVEPQYARKAMELYQELDKKKYCKVAVLDTEKVLEGTVEVPGGALAEEVVTKVPYARAYVDFLLGGVIKCSDTDSLRRCRVGITSDCMLYHGFKLQHINPEHYTRRAYIGEVSTRRRIGQLEKLKEKLDAELKPLMELSAHCSRILSMEALPYDVQEYMSWKKDIDELPSRKAEKSRLEKKLKGLEEQNIDEWKERQEQTDRLCGERKAERDKVIRDIRDTDNRIEECRQMYLEKNEALIICEKSCRKDEEMERGVQEFLKKRENPNYEKLQSFFFGRVNAAASETEEAMSSLRELRFEYLRNHPNRTFSAEDRDNSAYDELLGRLQYADLEELYAKADEQAQEAMELFKQDFIFKIRSAIREAFQRRDELNGIISRLDFGKDRYQFVITKNKGPDGRFFELFMDENLEVNPFLVSDRVENQMNFFTMNHESKYGEMTKELISIFIPPDNATGEELEEAKHNMEKYADYRTYLSFDMQQIIEGEGNETIKIRLSKMIKKNSGGEGQNPLYVALLASFAQAYRINLGSRLQRSPTIRLVVLDEAFSKMDAEKVASCIELIRGLGFQAIISATNDKIQNYLENVDKTFVFANPNKKHISIQEFEKVEFTQLAQELDEEE